MAKSKTSESPRTSSTVVLDLGGYNAKIGLASDDTPRVLSNCIFKAKSEKKRQFISNELIECKDQHQLFHMYPFSNGILTSWELEERILNYFFGKEMLNVDTKSSSLIITEPYFNFQSVKRLFTEAIFEEYEFESAFICPPAYLTGHLFRKEYPEEPTCLVIDSGHSSTHIIPIIEGNIAWQGIIRVPVGGKIITNHLKQRISFQQMNVMDESHVINQLKELTCFVSTDLKADFASAGHAHNPVTRTCGLPDYVHQWDGYVKPIEETFERPADHEQVIRLTADRFIAPEILFRPSIIGEVRMGVAEAAVQSIRRFPLETQMYLFRNIILTGGNCMFPGFKDRLLQEVGPEVPEFGEVEAILLRNPMTTAWFGGKSLAENVSFFDKVRVTKAEYEERGENVCDNKFVRCRGKF